MIELFRDCAASGSLPPRICMHSYSGSAETVKTLLGLETVCRTVFYFGFSAFVNLRSPAWAEKMRPIFAAVPLDRILIESDLISAHDIETELPKIAQAIVLLTGRDFESVVAQTRANAERFFQ
eukprot:TRINITY_DN384_c0_g1_i2.p2 TRINITY_DN384_c0_g1~~TRINITY_DN384_c0_g1_i2.p2  ORF type:complete len:123 (-),score=24.56 TRINITY_DN384_c0_g1_i2:20-388(-)